MVVAGVVVVATGSLRGLPTGRRRRTTVAVFFGCCFCLGNTFLATVGGTASPACFGGLPLPRGGTVIVTGGGQCGGGGGGVAAADALLSELRLVGNA